MKLNLLEKESALWGRIEAELLTERATLYIQLAGDKTHDESNKIRGRIAAINKILTWADNDDPKFNE